MSHGQGKLHAHKNATTIVTHKTRLVTLLQNYLTTLIYSLGNGLCKITTESIKLVLDVEQFGVRSNLIIPTSDAQKVSHFSFSSRYTR